MKHALILAMGLAVAGTTAHAQINALFPGEMNAPRASAERSSLLESVAELSLDRKVITRNAGHSSNPLYKIDLADGMRLTGLDWSLNIEASSPNKISDLRIAIYSLDESGDPTRGVLVGPGDGINFTGTMRVEDEWLGLSGDDGILNLASLGLDFAPGSDGSVYIELYTVFEDDTLTMERDSTLRLFTGVVPSPGTAAVLGVFGLTAVRRRRR